MAKLIITRGLPGSGKSYWANQQEGFVVVEKDEIRKDLEKTGWKWSRENEKDVLKIQADMILILLKEGQDIIAADTNFGKHEARLKNIADQVGADFAVKDFSEVPLELCLERNRNRDKKVPEEFIMKQYNDYIVPNMKIEKVEWVEGLPTAIICDLDGTLAIHQGRSPYDEEKCDTDALNKNVHFVLDSLDRRVNHIFFVSGRKDKGEVRLKTTKWLEKWGFFLGSHRTLLMRAGEDNRNDAIVKNEIFDQNIRGRYNVMCVLDDRDRVVKRWREMGLTCLQVAPGNF